MSQYDMTIVYIRGEDNTVADALSCVSPNAFPDEQLQVSLLNSSGSQLPPMVPIGAVLLIATDHLVLELSMQVTWEKIFTIWLMIT
jgi:hypothetical protein